MTNRVAARAFGFTLPVGKTRNAGVRSLLRYGNVRLHEHRHLLHVERLPGDDGGRGIVHVHSRAWHAAFGKIQYGRVLVPRLAGAARMADMMLTGRVLDADEGQAIGFSQYLVDEGQGWTRALEPARRIAANAPLSTFAVVQALPPGRWARSTRREGTPSTAGSPRTSSSPPAPSQGSGSATRPARALVLATPPSIDEGEVTDRGSINQRAVLAHRDADADVVRLYLGRDADVLRPAGSAD